MKPDWATRLQRTFARKYDAGFAKGLMFGKAVGAADERERILGGEICSLCHDACQEHGAKVEQTRIIKLLTDKASNTYAGVIYLHQAVALIKGEAE